MTLTLTLPSSLPGSCARSLSGDKCTKGARGADGGGDGGGGGGRGRSGGRGRGGGDHEAGASLLAAQDGYMAEGDGAPHAGDNGRDNGHGHGSGCDEYEHNVATVNVLLGMPPTNHGVETEAEAGRGVRGEAGGEGEGEGSAQAERGGGSEGVRGGGGGEQRRARGGGGGGGGGSEEETESGSEILAEKRVLDVRFVMGLCAAVLLVEILLIWISVKDLVINEDAWWNWLYALLAIVAVAGAILVKVAVGKATNKRREFDGMIRLLMPALFLFVYNATPSAGGEMYTYTYRLFYSDSPCRFQYLQLTSSATSVVGYLLYGAMCNRRRIRSVFLVTTLVGALAGLVWVPLSNVSLNASCVPLGSGSDARDGHTPCIDKYAYAVLATIIAGLFGTFASAPRYVEGAITRSPRKHPHQLHSHQLHSHRPPPTSSPPARCLRPSQALKTRRPSPTPSSYL